MKRFLLPILTGVAAVAAHAQESDSVRMYRLQQIEVTATRATPRTPVAYTDLSHDAIARNSYGTDIPTGAGAHPLDDRHQRNGHRHRRHVDPPARHGRHAPQRHDQRRGDEQSRLALDVLVRHARPDLGRRNDAGAARRRPLDQRHGRFRRRGQHDHRSALDRIFGRSLAQLRIVQHQQAGRRHFVGAAGRPLGRRRTADAHRLGRLHRPERRHGSEILSVPGRLLQRTDDGQTPLDSAARPKPTSPTTASRWRTWSATAAATTTAASTRPRPARTYWPTDRTSAITTTKRTTICKSTTSSS